MGIYYGYEIYGVRIVKNEMDTNKDNILYEVLFEEITREIKEELVKEYNKIDDFTNIQIYFFKEYTCSYEFDFENERTWVKCSSDLEEFKKLLLN